MWRAAAGAAIAASLLNAACMFRALRRNIEHFQRFAILTGAVDSTAPAGTATVVVLLRADTGEPVDSFALGTRGKYFFIVPPGTYYVAAFNDRDRNLRYDPVTEHGAWYGAPDPVRLVAGQTVDKIDLSVGTAGAVVLERPLTAPELGRRGLHELPDVNLGTVTTIDDRRFSSENGKLGMWQPVDFALRKLPGIYFLEPYDAHKIPVLFVHGITGHPGEFADLIAGLDRRRFQPWLLYYPSGGRLDFLGRVTLRWLAALGVRYDVRRLIIVAHSMGGLVARSALNEWVEAVAEKRAGKIDAFVTISTPWGGHAAAAAGVQHAPEVVPAWYDMTPGSDFLKGLLRSPLPAECRYYLLFGFEGGSALVGGVNDGVVAVSSELAPAAQEQAIKVYGFPEDHVSILRSRAVSERLNRILADVEP